MAGQTNIDQVLRDVDKALGKQIPFALSKGLNETGKDVVKALTAQLPKKLDRPTPFTQKAFNVKFSNKRNLVATVYVKPIQAKYMKYAILGGTRRPRQGKKALVMPRGVKLNKYGNMPRRKVQTLLARPDTFSGVINGVGGIWQRGVTNRAGNFSASKVKRATTVRLLLAYQDKASYNDIFPMQKITQGVFNARIAPNVSKAVEYAIATAL